MNIDRKSERTLFLAKEDLCASPNLAKPILGLPYWLHNGNINVERSDLYYEIVLKYFTFQGVIWFLEQDQDSMSTYFGKYLKKNSSW